MKVDIWKEIRLLIGVYALDIFVTIYPKDAIPDDLLIAIRDLALDSIDKKEHEES